MPTTLPRAVAGSQARPGTECPPNAPPVNHASAVRVAQPAEAVRLFDELVRGAFTRAWRNGRTLTQAESQPFRDAARGEGRPLGTQTLGRGLVALGSRQAAYGIAAAIMAWAERTFRAGGDDIAEAWAQEEREELESDLAVVQAIHGADVTRLDAAIAEQQDNVAAGLAVLSALRARRDQLVRVRPQGVAHYGSH